MRGTGVSFRTRPVTVDSAQLQATGTGVSRGGSLHSCLESSAVEPGEGQMGNVGSGYDRGSTDSVTKIRSGKCQTDG